MFTVNLFTWRCDGAEKSATAKVHSHMTFLDFVNGKVKYDSAQGDEYDGERTGSHDKNDDNGDNDDIRNPYVQLGARIKFLRRK